MTLIKKAAGIIIQDRKLLIERSKDKEFFISPGGTMEENETPVQTLIRELKEEFTIDVVEDDLEFFNTFTAAAAGLENTSLEMHVFFIRKYEGEIKPDSEVEEIIWADSTTPSKIPVGSIFAHEIIPMLQEQGLID